MKSFWISCAAPRASVPALAVLLALATATAPAAARGKERSIEDLTNFLLGPNQSQWLVGAVVELATEEEIAQYLRLTSDEAAAEFVEAFWQRREDPSRPWPQEQPQGVFERRAVEADKLFTEGTTLGRRTDRGKVHILFGPAEKVEFAPVSPPRRGTIEVWTYPKDAEPGLTGQAPRSQYYFLKQGDLTVAYNPSVRDRRRLGNIR